jgi:hyperosmotically inducible periplasmic protein
VKGSDARALISALAIAAVWTVGCSREEETPPVDPGLATAQPVGQPTDPAITTGVQARYYTDDLVRGRNVAVSTDNGMVTLRGTVQSEEAKQRAVTLAREVRGVRDVRDELRVQSAGAAPTAESGPATSPADTAAGTSGRAETDSAQTPAWITTKIQAQYFVSPEIKPWNIDVTTANDGVVTLEGEVETTQDREEAVRIARTTEGVKSVENRLRIKGEQPREPAAGALVERPDVWLTAKVQSKYFLDELVKLRAIDVTTENGTVTLTGTVGSEAEKRRAVALARSTEGVQNVNDRLQVDAALQSQRPGDGVSPAVAPVGGLKRPDPWITMKVQSQYFLDPEIKGHQIDVDTNNAVVLLKGTVASDALKQQAERIAKDTEGVARVVNQLTVKGQ